jgi:hypothetical protein
VPTLIVLVRVKGDVEPADYERWLLESYAPAATPYGRVGLWETAV